MNGKLLTLSSLYEHGHYVVANRSTFKSRDTSGSTNTDSNPNNTNSKNINSLCEVLTVQLRGDAAQDTEEPLPAGYYSLGFQLYAMHKNTDNIEKLLAWDVIRVHRKLICDA